MNHTLSSVRRLPAGALALATGVSIASVATALPAQAQDTPGPRQPHSVSETPASPGADELRGDPAVGASGTRTLTTPTWALGPGSGSAQDGAESLQDINRKLSNPVSDVWALFTEFDLSFSDGNAVQGRDEVGGRMIFQPIMPVPLYGEGPDEWKLVSRPTLPIMFSQPIPTGFDQFTHVGGMGDLQVPTLINPPTGKLAFALGPDWLFPTASRTELGRQQWGVGPSGVFGYVTREFTAVVLPQYYFGIGGWGDKPDANYMNLLYAFIYHLPGGWDIGTNPTINYDHTASAGNQWNVPIGLFVGKMLKLGKVPVKFQLGIEYSVVSEARFGQQAQIKLNVIPVIRSLVGSPIFGGQ